MKRKIFTLIAGTMLVASIGQAAPLADLQQGETNIGYDHYNLNSNLNSDGFYLEGALSDRFILGVDRNNYNDAFYSATDIYGQYKIDPNIRLIAGNRSYDNTNEFFYGVGATVNLAPRLDGYASVTTGDIATEWQAGVNYKIDNQTGLQVGYKSYKEDPLSTKDGLGFGINHKF
jgi:hypothetical protein